MENNLIEKYELINGTAIVDNDLNIITANEELYRFMGDSLNYSILEVIHQVDLDDFIEVTNNIRNGNEKNMVVRMRRSDNSYRWMLVGIQRKEWSETSADDVPNHNTYSFYSNTASFHGQTYRNNHTSSLEYLELHVSDIIALKKQNTSLQSSVLDFRHLLAMENELFFTYDFHTDLFRINHFIDNNIINLFELPIDRVSSTFVETGYISPQSAESFQHFCNDIRRGTVSFSYQMKADFTMHKSMYQDVEFKGSTIYSQMQPYKAVGSIRNIHSADDNYNIKTYEYNNDKMSSYNEVRAYCEKNIMYDPNCKLTLILMEIDHMDRYRTEEGETFAKDLYHTTLQTTKKLVGYRGTVCEIQNNLISIAINDFNSEAYIRAFVQSLRSSIAWNYQKKDVKYNITFSIGIARYPQDGTNLSDVHRKLVRALEMAEDGGRNQFVLYRDYDDSKHNGIN